MPNHEHHRQSDNKKYHDKKKKNRADYRRKNNPPSHLSHSDDHNPGKTTHPQFLDELPKTTLHRYQPKELSYLLQQNANRRDISQLSAAAQHRLKKPARMCLAKSDVQKLVEEWFPVLDEIFFFSTVGPRLKNGIHLFKDPESTQGGFYIEKKSYIKLNTDSSMHCIGEQRSERGFLATLLHEMVHAFLKTFSCGEKCCKSYASEVIGHEAIWCNAIVKIEAKFEEFMKESNWQPKEDQLVRWGLRGTEVYNSQLRQDVSFVRSEWSSARGSRRPTADFEEESSEYEDDPDFSDDSYDSNNSFDSFDSEDSNSFDGSDDSDGSDGSDDSDSENEHEKNFATGKRHQNLLHNSSHGSHHSYRHQEGNSHRKKEHHRKDRSRHESSRPQFLNKLPNPKLHGFHPEEFGKVLRQNTRDQSFSQLSVRAQDLLQAPIPHCETTRDVRHLMKIWLQVLDEIFYFGQVRQHLEGGIRVLDDPEIELEGEYDPQKCLININIAGHHYHDGQIEQHYVDTLVHEMLHAFLINFTCRKMCCWSKMMNNPDWQFVGLGHGPVWVKTMREIEEKLTDLVGWDVHCGINDSIEVEKKEGGKTRGGVGCKPIYGRNV
ncbi:hypothetical protein N431DRAFT_451715 [Stipitochalara longipes BDJ]|nr:hypothetical protein N431DRAFT_451715 [Stipitochalara longipes BDJ]